MKISSVIILAAGLGKRMKSYTKTTPKPLIRIGRSTLIETIIKKLELYGIKKIVINLFYLKNKIKKKLNTKYKLKIFFSEEKILLNTGGGVKKAREILNAKEFFVINSDIIWTNGKKNLFYNLNNYWNKDKMDGLLLLYPVKKIKKKFFGDFYLDDSGLVIEKNKSLPYVFTGIQILKSNLFSNINKKAFPLSLIYKNLIKKKKLYGLVHDGKWFHLGTIDSLNQYKKMLR